MSKRSSAAPKEREEEVVFRSSPNVFSLFFRGLVQATRLDVALAAVSRSNEAARAAALQCFCFNGLIFVSLLLWRWAVAPAVAAAAAAGQSYSFPPLLSALTAALFAPRPEGPSSRFPLEITAAFILGWVFPASAVALSLSGPWCLAVAKGVFEEEERRRRGSSGGGGSGRSRSRSRSRSRAAANRGATSSPSPTMTTRSKSSSSSSSDAAAAVAEALELYRGTLFSLLWTQAGLSRLALSLLLPRRLALAGPLASTLLTWLLYGLMAFDYRFSAESSFGKSGRKGSSSSAAVGVAERFAAFGRFWPFYLAFGIVAASPSLVLPFWEGMSAVAALYPLFVALAASGDASPGAAGSEEGAPSSAAAAAAGRRRRFSLLSFVFSPAILLTDLVVSVLTPLAWRVGGRAASLLGLRKVGGQGQRGRQR